jgi:hypothetical protein
MTAREKITWRARFRLGLCTHCGERFRMPRYPECAVCAEERDQEAQVAHGTR